MVPVAQTDFFDFLSKLLALADKDPSVLLAFFLVLAGIYLVIDKLAKVPGALSSWRKRRKGETPIDPNVKLLNDLAESIALLTKNQNQNADNTKRLIDRADLLEGLVTQNTTANTKLADVTDRLGALITGAMSEMRGAQKGIVEQVNTHTDENTAGLTSTLRGVKDTVEKSASNITALAQKADERHVMTEQKLKELLASVEKIPDELRAALVELQAQASAKDTEIAQLKATIADQARTIERMSANHSDNTGPKLSQDPTEQLDTERRLHALHESPPAHADHPLEGKHGEAGISPDDPVGGRMEANS